ncbi:MAG: DNA gyrase subunit A [Thermoplasmatota archaeon]
MTDADHTPTDVAPSDRVAPRPVETELRQSFLDYAMSVIVSRALPDARDGLKPVHRRILYAMSEIGMSHTTAYKKSANVVGEVLGKYHPHGDGAIYDAMVRMAQDWSLRYPLVDGQGNFGSVDGDGAAAMRYTEARMARITSEVLSDLDKDTVDWAPNYDGSRQEPRVLPAALPNLLVNGSDGIAVGMATKMPPHNLSEVVDATVALIDDPELSPLDLSEFVKGPDFPTGGIIHGRGGIMQAIAGGRGRVIVRGKYEIEAAGKDKERIVFSEIPYQVNKANLLMAIADLAKDKVVEGISDLRDESDRRGMRLVIELKKDAITDVVLNQLWKHTALQSSYSINNLALVDGRPRTLGLKELLRVFTDHRFEVVTRRTQYELDKAEKRAHILEGLLVALDRIDEVVALIRGSADAETARNGLMETFELSEVQAKAILDMRLQKLTGLESDELRSEHAGLLVKIAELKAILADDGKVYAIIKEELLHIKETYGDERRTAIEEGEIDIDDESLIPEEDCIYLYTQEGYLKRMPLDTYREQNRGGRGLKGMQAKEGDHLIGTVVGSTHDHLCFFTNHGRVHWLKGYRVPMGSRQARGKPVQNLIQLDGGERVENIIPVRDFDEEGQFLFFATKRGLVKRTPLSAFRNVRVVGIKAIELRDGDELLAVRRTDGERNIILASRNGQACRFQEEDVRSMGRVAAGVRGMTLGEGDSVVAVAVAEPDTELLTVTQNGYGKRTPLDDYRLTRRGGKGVRTIVVNDRNGGVVALRTVRGDESLLIITRGGMVVRTPVDQVSQQGRSTQGVTVMRMSKDDEVIQVAVLPAEAEEDAAGDAQQEKTPPAQDESRQP